MDQRRVILAVLLMFVVAIVPSLLFRPKQPVGRPGGRPDTSLAAPAAAESAAARAPAPPPTAPPTVRPTAALPAETVWVSGPLYRYGFTTRGARLIAAEIKPYTSFAPGDSGGRVQLVPPEAPLLGMRIVVGNDTASLADTPFTPDQKSLTVSGDTATLTFTAAVGNGSVTVIYQFVPADYHFSVNGHVEGLGGSGGVLIVGLGQGLHSVEAEPLSDYREYAVVTKADKTQKEAFASIDPGKRVVMDGPFEWVGVKSKYFFAAILAPDQNLRPFAGAVATGEPREQVTVASLFGNRTSLLATRASVVTTLALPPTGAFHYEVYLGPFEHRRLDQLGHGLDDANPYGWSIFRPIIHPVSIVVVRILFWMHGALRLPYGWVLIAFGVLIRLLLWPLQRRAMESQMRMQAVQPLMQDIQTRYKNDPERLQKEMMRLYKEHKVNPFGGCLPMLLPMPVLLALFFVFSNTIEFRGVPFLWLPDLSRADPLFIIPVIMGVSMFAVSKIGQRGMPPNPQTKTFLYVMPAMMTFIFLRLASGLNLYYAVQNLISLPQQWQISKRRLAAQSKPAGG
ncbi:MAG TPA: membrane protein insertase YidC [Gemmatimonadales bacterium]|nr:membrane protein insertase YidC [Gemmatimonadales bacterium]